MTRVVRTHYRYKHPPRRKKAVALEVPAVVRAVDPAVRRRPMPAPPESPAAIPAVVSTSSKRAGTSTALPAANDDHHQAIVTIRRKSSNRFGKAEDITVEEANRRADLANAMMQDFKRQIAEKPRSGQVGQLRRSRSCSIARRSAMPTTVRRPCPQGTSSRFYDAVTEHEGSSQCEQAARIRFGDNVLPKELELSHSIWLYADVVNDLVLVLCVRRVRNRHRCDRVKRVGGNRWDKRRRIEAKRERPRSARDLVLRPENDRRRAV